MAKRALLQFGISRKTGCVVDITMVKRGLACDCVCPDCGAPLLARKAQINIHHFSHYINGMTESPCKGSLESSLHRAARQLIAGWKSITTPGLNVSEGGFSQALPGRTLQITQSELPDDGESRNFRSKGSAHPDVILHSFDDHLWCEVKVTHGVDEDKRAKLMSYGMPTLEFDLSCIHKYETWTLATLDLTLRTDASIKRWVFNPEEEKVREKFRKLRQELDAAYHRTRTAGPSETARLATPLPFSDSSRDVSLVGDDPWACLNLQDCGELVFDQSLGLVPKNPHKRFAFISRSYSSPKSYQLNRTKAFLRVHPHWDSTCIVTFAASDAQRRINEYMAALSNYAMTVKLTLSHNGTPESIQVHGHHCYTLLDAFFTRLKSD